MKKLIVFLLSTTMCFSFAACGEGASNNEITESTTIEVPVTELSATDVPGTETPVTEIPVVTEYAIGEAFGTDSVECVVTNVAWITEEDITNYKKTNGLGAGELVRFSDLFKDYSFYGISGVKDTKGLPYLCVTFTLQNVGKTLVSPTIQDNNWGASFNSYGNISIIYDDGYTFDAEVGFNKTLEVLGDASKEGRIFKVPAQVFENEDKALKVKITLPNVNGEIEEFIVSVR